MSLKLTLTLAALALSGLAFAAGTAPAAKKKPAPAAKVTTKPATPQKLADAGVPAVAAPPPVADAGVAPKVEAKDTKAPVDAKAAKDAKEEKDPKPATAGAKYTLVAVTAPDKKIERLWKSKCSSCHGVDGKAQTEKGKKMKMNDLSLAAWQTGHSDEDVKQSILKGEKEEKDGVKQEMDAFEGELKAEEVDALVKYVRFVGAPK